MSKLEKLVQKIFDGNNVTFSDAEKILLHLGYQLNIRGSHHVFRKPQCQTITIKKRPQLLLYQINDLKEVLKDHGY